MITKMTKYSMILLSGDLETFMTGIQQLGMVDITRSTVNSDDESRQMASLITRCGNAVERLGNLLKEHPDIKPIERPETTAERMLSDFEDNTARREAIAAELSALEKEYNSALPWGEFNPEDLDRLRSAGLIPHFYCLSDKQYLKQWEDEYPLQVLNRTQGRTYFAVLAINGEDYSFPAEESAFPSTSADTILSSITRLKEEYQGLAQRQRSDMLPVPTNSGNFPTGHSQIWIFTMQKHPR